MGSDDDAVDHSAVNDGGANDGRTTGDAPRRARRRVAGADATRSWPVATPPTERIHVPPPTSAATAPRATGNEVAPERRRSLWRMAAMGLAVVAAIAAAVVVGTRSYDEPVDDGDGVITDTPNPKYPPQDDVSLDECRIEPTGVFVSGTVRNPTDEPADYVIEVHLVDPDGTIITSASPTALGVPAETRTQWTGTIPPKASMAPSATCKIVQVDRRAA